MVLTKYNYEFYNQKTDRARILLYLGLILSVITCIFVFVKETIQLKLDKRRFKVPHFENLITSGRIKWILVDWFIILLHPYPFLIHSGYSMYNSILQADIYYNINEFLQICAMVRIVKAGIKLINLTVWRSNSSQRICIMYGCEADSMFGVKAMMKHRPISFLFSNLIAGAIFFGILVKYSESPINRVIFDSTKDLSRLENCIWLVVVTMTTVGYGDIYPRTLIGRAIIFVCAIYGVVVVSVMVVAIQNTLEFTVLEEKAFTCINKLNARKQIFKDASKMVGKLLILNRKPPTTESAMKKSLMTLRKLSSTFMKNNRYYKGIYDNDYSNEFFRQFDLLKEDMKEVNFFLSIICKIIFNDKKYKDVANLSHDDLLSIQMLTQLKDKKEMEIMKDQFIINQKEGLSEKLIEIRKKQDQDSDRSHYGKVFLTLASKEMDGKDPKQQSHTTGVHSGGTKNGTSSGISASPVNNLYSVCKLCFMKFTMNIEQLKSI